MKGVNPVNIPLPEVGQCRPLLRQADPVRFNTMSRRIPGQSILL